MSSTESSTPVSFPFQDFQVPDEPGVWFCPRHKSVRTRLRCGRCEKPICPKCTVMAPTGARCGDCASFRHSHIYKISPQHYVIAFLASLAIGGLGALLTHIAGGLWLWVLLYAPVVGPLWSRVITRITGGKRGPSLVGVVCGGIIVGAMAAAVGFDMVTGSSLPAEMLSETGVAVEPSFSQLVLGATLLNFPLLAFVFVAVAGVWWSLK